MVLTANRLDHFTNNIKYKTELICFDQTSIFLGRKTVFFYEVNSNSKGEIRYSGDLKSNHKESRKIQNPDFLKIGFQMLQFSKGWAIAKTIKNQTIQNLDIFI